MSSGTGSAWDEFLNPDVVRAKLAGAGMLLVGFEMLKSTILRRPRDFLASTFSGPEMVGAESPEYQAEVRGRDPQGKGDRLRGSLAFHEHLEATDAEDTAAFWALNRARNEVAHELPQFIMQGRHLPAVDHLPELTRLLRKIETWWVVNVEIATDPEVNALDIATGDILPGSVLMFETLVHTATGDDDAARAFYAAFKAQQASGARSA